MKAKKIGLLSMFCLVFTIVFSCSSVTPAFADTGDDTTITYTTSSGEKLRLHLIGWDDISIAVKATEPIDKLPMISMGGEETEVALTESSAINSLTADDKEELKDLASRGVPIVCEGGEAELAKLLGVSVVDETEPEEYELFAIKITDGKIYRSHFLHAPLFKQEIRINLQDQEVIPLSDSERVLESQEEIRSVLLKEALNWAVSDQAEETLKAPELSSEVYRAMGLTANDQGAWSAIGDPVQWVWPLYSNIDDDGGKKAVVYTVKVSNFKIQDTFEDRDWYLTDVRVHHQANAETEYHEDCCITGTCWTGWYVDQRDIKVERGGSEINNYFLEDYGPTGTIGSGTVGISIGGGISVSDKPGADISASYSKSYTQQDVTIVDKSSYADYYAKWEEYFKCPKGGTDPWTGYGACGLGVIDWPCANSEGSFYSDRAVIYKTTDLEGGIKLKITPRFLDRKDKIEGKFLWVEVTNYWHDKSYPRDITIFHNNRPLPPETPSVITPVWTNEESECSTSGTDMDGDKLDFKFHFGDSESDYLSGIEDPNVAIWRVSENHAWTSPGEYGVRARARDSPHNKESDWSDSFKVFVKGLDHIEIQGPDEVNEESSANFQCIASVRLESGISTVDVTDPGQPYEGGEITWSVTDSPWASISSNGILTANDMTGAGGDKEIKIKACYTLHGVTKEYSKTVTLVDLDIDDDGLSNDDETTGWFIDWRKCGEPTEQWQKDSDPSDPDTDDDGLTDAEEKEGWTVTVEGKTSYSVRSSPRDKDIDQDGLNDTEEKAAGTDPCNYDTDCDGAYDTNDGFELANGLDPLNPDTNDDGVSDGVQIDYWLDAGFTLEEAIAKSIDHWPIADANGPYAGEEGSAITFEASGSDPDGDPLTYRWDFNNDNEWDTEWSSDPTAEYTYGDDFFETAKVEVSDGLLSVIASASVTVNNVAPSARIDAIEQPNPHIILPVVHTLSFTGSFTDPGWLDTHTSIWDFGDESSDAGTLTEENDEPDATGTTTTEHAYSEPGTYTVTLAVTDDDGGIGTDTTTMIVISAEEALQEVNDYIQDLPDSYFKNNPDQRKNAFSEKIDETLELIDEGEYQDAIDKLQHDIRAKAAGLVDGKPANDWIIDPESQREICTMIDDLVAYLETKM